MGLSDSDESSCSDDEMEATNAVESIEDITLQFLNCLLQVGEDISVDGDEKDAKCSAASSQLSISLVDRTKCGQSFGGIPPKKHIIYPRRSRNGSIRPLAQMFRVLDIMHDSVISGIPGTKRDIYYRDVPLFKYQKTVDTLVDDIAATFSLNRSDLNVRATSKGLLCGSCFSMTLHSGEIIQGSDSKAMLIPTGEDIKSFSVCSVSWVLIVEKDAVFQTLSHMELTRHSKLPGPGLLITGKGYPDIATRHLVKKLSDSLPLHVPIMALVDGDAYGIDIVSVYKYGSQSLQHENEKLTAHRVIWLGLWPSEFASFGIDRDTLIPLTSRDEKKALSMLQRPISGMPEQWRKELTSMLHNRRKAEIEILSSRSLHQDQSKDETVRTETNLGTFSSSLLDYLLTKISIFVDSANVSIDAL